MLHLVNAPLVELRMPNIMTLNRTALDPPDPAPDASAPVRILLVEDDTTNAFFMQEMLESMGIPTPIHARNGREALECLSSQRVDMVFMDCRMPEMDGYEATRLWREQESQRTRPSHMPIIALTANVMAEDRESCLAAGMDDFLSKPVTEKDLRQVLVTLFGERVAFLQHNEPAPTPDAPPPDTESGRTVLNLSALEELCAALGEESVQNLIQTFLDGLPAKLDELHQGVLQSQVETIHRIAHTLKSNCGILKAERMADLCMSLSALSAQQKMDSQIPTLEQQLVAEKAKLVQAIQTWISSRTPPPQT